jgi:hypothetical protein
MGNQVTDLHKDIWQQIEEQRANYQRIINAATDTINNARKLIADAREGMDSLPVAKTRRARKGGADEGAEHMGAHEFPGGGARLPGAAELFPHGIERVRTYCVDDVSAEAASIDEIVGGKS